MLKIFMCELLPISILLNLTWYFLSFKYKSNCFVDFGWGMNQTIMGLYLYFKGDLSLTRTNSIILLALWGLRLSLTILFERILKKHNDERYEFLRNKRNLSEKMFYTYQYTFQAILMLFPFSTFYFVMKNTDDSYGIFYLLGNSIALIGIIFEGLSDYQLKYYIKKKIETKDKKKDLCRLGFWKNSRHPNLFFEIIFWFGMSISTLDKFGNIYSIFGVFSIWFIIYKITIPITERVMKNKRENWNEWIKGTNKLSIF